METILNALEQYSSSYQDMKLETQGILRPRTIHFFFTLFYLPDFHFLPGEGSTRPLISLEKSLGQGVYRDVLQDPLQFYRSSPAEYLCHAEGTKAIQYKQCSTNNSRMCSRTTGAILLLRIQDTDLQLGTPVVQLSAFARTMISMHEQRPYSHCDQKNKVLFRSSTGKIKYNS